MRTLILIALLVFSNIVPVFGSWENSENNYENSRWNHDNSEWNYKNSKWNYNNSQWNPNRNEVTFNDGNTGYAVRKSNGDINIFSDSGKRVGYVNR